MLAFPLHGYTYILDTDASGFAIGGVLSQLQPKSMGDVEVEIQEPIALEEEQEIEKVDSDDDDDEGLACTVRINCVSQQHSEPQHSEILYDHLLEALEVRRTRACQQIEKPSIRTREESQHEQESHRTRVQQTAVPRVENNFKLRQEKPVRNRLEQMMQQPHWRQISESQKVRLISQHEKEMGERGKTRPHKKLPVERNSYKIRERERLCQLVRVKFGNTATRQVNSLTTSGECHESELELAKPKDTTGVEMIERPISYASRMLLPRELKYCARRREFLAIYEMVQYFRHYLAGSKFIIRTDHDSLKAVKNLE